MKYIYLTVILCLLSTTPKAAETETTLSFPATATKGTSTLTSIQSTSSATENSGKPQSDVLAPGLRAMPISSDEYDHTRTVHHLRIVWDSSD